ncbi:MAG: hypothetical protein K0R46_1831 [Herbinix sp.]|nr:hypothetical protein [Herbinix sp.]
MDYDKKLILKAVNKRCDVCKDFITEDEANNCEFYYSRTSGNRDIFVHIKCWLKAWTGGVMMKIKLIVTWYDIWIGIFIDRTKKAVYIFLVPCIGIKISKEVS